MPLHQAGKGHDVGSAVAVLGEIANGEFASVGSAYDQIAQNVGIVVQHRHPQSGLEVCLGHTGATGVRHGHARGSVSQFREGGRCEREIGLGGAVRQTAGNEGKVPVEEGGEVAHKRRQAKGASARERILYVLGVGVARHHHAQAPIGNSAHPERGHHSRVEPSREPKYNTAAACR